jgi:hypothetical protein
VFQAVTFLRSVCIRHCRKANTPLSAKAFAFVHEEQELLDVSPRPRIESLAGDVI